MAVGCLVDVTFENFSDCDALRETMRTIFAENISPASMLGKYGNSSQLVRSFCSGSILFLASLVTGEFVWFFILGLPDSPPSPHKWIVIDSGTRVHPEQAINDWAPLVNAEVPATGAVSDTGLTQCSQVMSSAHLEILTAR